MNKDERYEIDSNGSMVTGLPESLTQAERKQIIREMFSINGWSYRLINEISPSHYLIELKNNSINVTKEYHLFHGNIRKEDPERNRKEKKIQLGMNNDPRDNYENALILGFYIYGNNRDLKDVIVASWPVEMDKDYPGNPSLRINAENDILPAKNYGYYLDKVTGKNLVVFRPEFVYYFLENYRDSQYSDIHPLSFRSNFVLDPYFERNRIVFGAPGTGKSYKLKEDSKILLEDTSGTLERVTFYADYSYAHFVGTYKPVTNNNDEISYEFVPGPFMKVYVNALKSGLSQNPQPHVLLIEEINRAKVSAVFGDIFQLLDRNKEGVSEYEISASNDICKYLAKELGGEPDRYKQIKIPDNMFIWATMNSADQGVFPIDTAFKRRWNFEYLGIDTYEEGIRGRVSIGNGTHIQEVEWNKLRKAINERLVSEFKVNEDKLLGPYFLGKDIIETDENLQIIDEEKFKEAFKSKIIMYLYEDAAKQYRNKFFEGCESGKYSSVCDAFDEKGIAIFGDSFTNLFFETQE